VSKYVSIDVYFEVFCSECGDRLVAIYDENRKELTVEPCKTCLEYAIEEERNKNENNGN